MVINRSHRNPLVKTENPWMHVLREVLFKEDNDDLCDASIFVFLDCAAHEATISMHFRFFANQGVL